MITSQQNMGQLQTGILSSSSASAPMDECENESFQEARQALAHTYPPSVTSHSPSNQHSGVPSLIFSSPTTSGQASTATAFGSLPVFTVSTAPSLPERSSYDSSFFDLSSYSLAGAPDSRRAKTPPPVRRKSALFTPAQDYNGRQRR